MIHLYFDQVKTKYICYSGSGKNPDSNPCHGAKYWYEDREEI